MPQNSPYTLEICVETPDALNACVGIADRIELCAGLDIGGLTPCIGLMKQVKASGLETHVLIRTRSGDFTMSDGDITVAVAAIQEVRALGLHGVVIGAERDGALDRSAMDAMVQAADGLDITLHRVIDVLDDPVTAMEQAINLGAKRILTSGAAQSAPDGIAGLTTLHTAAAGRIEIMAGAGINSRNITSLLDQTDITSFHASCSAKTPLASRYVDFGFGETKRAFDAGELRALSDRLG